ncbi:MAG: hypothetical protein ACJ8BW_00615 [Ktedonobacteraceae bacterium]
MGELDRLQEGVRRIKEAERGEEPVTQRDFLDLPAGDTLAIEGKRVGRSNGGVACDVTRGPCSCGAWH